MEVDFDEDGNPKMPTIVASPKMASQFEQLDGEFDADPDVRRRYEELIEKKRQQFLTREADRKLVG